MGDVPRNVKISLEQMALAWKRGYESYFSRPLTDSRFPYLWADVKQIKLGGNFKRNYLSIVGVNLRGERKLLALSEAEPNSKEIWHMLLRRLERRDLGNPRLFVGRADLPLWDILPQVFPRAEIQFCWNDFKANMLEQFPREFSDEVESRLVKIQFAESRESSEEWIDYFKNSFGKKYPRAVTDLLKNKSDLLSYLSFPRRHWRNIRTDGFIAPWYPSRALLETVCKYEPMKDVTLYLVFNYLIRSQPDWPRLKGRRALRNVQKGRKFINGKQVSSRKLKKINSSADKKTKESRFGIFKKWFSKALKQIAGKPKKSKKIHSKPAIDKKRSAQKMPDKGEALLERSLMERWRKRTGMVYGKKAAPQTAKSKSNRVAPGKDADKKQLSGMERELLEDLRSEKV
jgi:hypothetical protein